MEMGAFRVEQLSEGHFRIFEDGHIRREPSSPYGHGKEGGGVPEGLRRPGYRIGIGPILVSRGDTHLLLDAGLGWGLDAGSAYGEVSNVLTNLEIFGLGAGDIAHVVLSHLHYDHAAGCTWSDAENVTRPTFPNARYHLQRAEWDDALARYDRDKVKAGAGYELDELFRLAADGRFHFLEDRETEIVPGIRVMRTGGHTPGHQAVRVGMPDEEGAFWYLGDLLPTHGQLNHYDMQHMDRDPLEAKKQKVRLLKRIYREQGVLLFYHSRHARSGTLLRDERQRYILNEKS
ncbi:MAG: MBL fold metallo-hydrolase [Balneolaceae bacterium]|nr:MBL fold metallo-hydrolase [Balneolaceae bacterium]